MAAIPAGIESWRNPSVLENTSAAKTGAAGDGPPGACDLAPQATTIDNPTIQQHSFNLQSSIFNLQSSIH